MHEDFLLNVQKPARYINHEWNAVRKDPRRVKLKFCLAYPDVYEVGMSHLGSKILYGILNQEGDILCERVFAPWPDWEKELRQRDLTLRSLENAIALAEFDCIGFSLSYEMNYTNIITMLELSGIPLKAEERGEFDPLIIAGGGGLLNLEPVAEFFDAIVIGEAEDAIREIASSLKDHSRRKDRLENLIPIEGVYVPNSSGVRPVIKKRGVSDFENSFYPTRQVVPYIAAIHDRIPLEIMRGCPNRCRFCQARSSYYPVRIRSKEKILSLARESINATGYETISLISLSSSQHPEIIDILNSLTTEFEGTGVSLSLPSLRIGDILNEFPAILNILKKSGLTFAVEAASERLRSIVGKELNIESLKDAALAAYRAGWRRIKLYFMIGLPGETEEDLKAIIRLSSEISELRKEVSSGRGRVNVSIANFVPKPHTPFQWEAFDSIPALEAKQRFLKQSSRPASVKLNFHDVRLSFLEALFSRGDRRLTPVLIRAHKLGARFDSWREFFRFDLWQEALVSENVDLASYLKKRENYDEILPWDHIDCGVSKEELIKEAQEARKLIDAA